MVMCDVDSSQIPILVPKEIDDINNMKYCCNDYGIADRAMDFILPCAEGEVDESPCHDARAAVGEKLYVPGA